MNQDEAPFQTPHSAVSPGSPSASESSDLKKYLRSADRRSSVGISRSYARKNSASENQRLPGFAGT